MYDKVRDEKKNWAKKTCKGLDGIYVWKMELYCGGNQFSEKDPFTNEAAMLF